MKGFLFMNIQQLTISELSELYNTNMIYDFPSDELKSLKHLIQLIHENNYICFGFQENGHIIAYALFCKAVNGNYLLLDYFAVCREYRNCGYGSKLIPLLKETCKEKIGILAEVENPESIQEENRKQYAIRRIEFYKRNGWIITSVCSSLFHVDYIIIQLPIQKLSDSFTILSELEDIYHAMFNEQVYLKNVQLYNKAVP